MKRSIWLGLASLGLILVLAHASEVMLPVAVSPGRDSGLAVVAQGCPTFSWTAVDWAAGYRVAVFPATGQEVLSYEEMKASAKPVVSQLIQGRALAWTPSSGEGLSAGEMYVWYVQAMDLGGRGLWSQGKAFIVGVGEWTSKTEQKVKEELQKKGVSGDVISEVLKDMKARAAALSVVKPQSYEGPTCTFLGQGAGQNTNFAGYYDTYIGTGAGYKNVTLDNNTFLGYNAGYWNSSGYGDNTFLGTSAGYSTDWGYYNTFVGRMAGYYNTSGFTNTFIGRLSGLHNNIGNGNTFLGEEAGYTSQSGSYDVFLGLQAGYYETGSNKLYIANSSTTTPLIYGDFVSGIVNINGKLGIGTPSPAYPLHIVRTGSSPAFVINRTDGSQLYMGAGQAEALVGSITNHPFKIIVNGGTKMTLSTDGSLVMSNGAKCTVGGVWNDASSRTLKENIEGLTVEEAQGTLAELSPVKYNYRVDKSERHVGFIAEDVPELVASKDRKSLSPMDVVAVLTKVVQEQQKTISDLRARIAEIEEKSKSGK